MDASNNVRLARWFNARGIRMMKCAGHVESCAHYKAFKALADGKFAERDRLMEMVRVKVGRAKRWKFFIEDSHGVFSGVRGFDELSAGAEYEAVCELLGVTPGNYRVVKRRDRT